MAEVKPESLLVQFYRGRASDGAGRMIDEIWRWDDRRLEMVHDYIQWLFPIAEASRFNPDAPVLTSVDAAAFRGDADLLARLKRSLALMLAFYGFIQTTDGIVRGPAFTGDWVTPLNHNYLRLTRMMICLAKCGLVAKAEHLLQALESVAGTEGRDIITSRTLDFWRGAVSSS